MNTKASIHALVESGLGFSQVKTVQDLNERVYTSWKETGFLDGLKESEARTMAQLYENQLTWMAENQSMLNETTDSYSSGQFSAVVFPVMRRTYTSLLANELVTVYALNMPTGRIYYMRPLVSSRKPDTQFRGVESHTPPNNAYQNERRAKDLLNTPNADLTAAGITAKGQTVLTEFDPKNLYDSFYATEYDFFGTSLFDRTSGKVKIVSDLATLVSGTIGTSAQVRIKLAQPFSLTNEGKLIGANGTPMDTEAFLASFKVYLSAGALEVQAGDDVSFNKGVGDQLHASVYTPRWGDQFVNRQTGEIFFNIDLSYPSSRGYVPYTSAGAVLSYSYNEYASMEAESEMAEISFTLEYVNLATESRKLRTRWTPELTRDVQAYQNINAEAELTDMLSMTLAHEIDMMVMRDLTVSAAWTARWDYRGLEKLNSGGNIKFFGNQRDYNQTFIDLVNKISAQIQKSTLNGGANWIVVSTEISAILNQLEYFHVSDASAESMQYTMGIEKYGSLRNGMTVYVNPNFPAGLCLIGRKPTQQLQVGYIYAPYVPLELTATLQSPNDFTMVKGISTRFAKKMVFARYYGRIIVDGLTTWDLTVLQ